MADKQQLLDHFSRDPQLFALHIGDLDDFYFQRCRWLTLGGKNEPIKESILIYQGPSTPTVLALGKSDEFPAFLDQSLTQLPDKFYCHYQDPNGEIIRKIFDEQPFGEYFKMGLTPEAYRPPLSEDREIKRLHADNVDDLVALYRKAYPGNYFDKRMLGTGKYLGYFKDNELIGVAGVHVDSDEFNIAVLGNITTHPDHRRRGVATKLTSALVGELVEEKKVISLNVHSENDPAIRAYRRLGFRIIHRYREGLFARR